MLGKNKRKGFTLAELLIVVAIIAVLVAIAVPLFISGLSKAQNATFEANKRSLKSTAVAQILFDDTFDYDANFGTTTKAPIYATASVNEKGTIGEITFSKSGSETENYKAWKAAENDNITVKIEYNDLKAIGTIADAGAGSVPGAVPGIGG